MSSPIGFTLFFKKLIPFSLLIIAGLTPADYKIEFLTQQTFIFKKKRFKNALVGITCLTPSAKRAYKLALKLRSFGACVVMGGPHVSVLPEEALQYADSVVIGEAESVWKIVIEDYENKSLKKIYKGEPLDDFFSPVYEYFLNLDPRILRRTLIPVSRGCKYHCDFCARIQSKPRYIKTEQLIPIIKRIKKKSYIPFFDNLFPLKITFSDDNIFSNPQFAKMLFKELIPLKINWISQSSIDISFDEEALKLAQQSGCKLLFIGLETLYPKELQKTSVHNISSLQDYIKAIRTIKSYRIKIIGSFILGFDYYNHADYLRLLFFLMSTVIKARLYLIALTILTPFPGSALFERLKRENRIITYDWGKYDLLFHVVFRPKITRFQLLMWFFSTRVITLFCSSQWFTILIISVIFVWVLDYSFYLGSIIF